MSASSVPAAFQPSATGLEQFHIEEFKALRHEIDEKIREIVTVQTHLVIAVALIWTYLFDHHQLRESLLWYLPALLSFLSALRTWMLAHAILRIGGYIAEIEEVFAVGSLGWERRVRSPRTYYFELFSVVFHALLIAVALLLAFNPGVR